MLYQSDHEHKLSLFSYYRSTASYRVRIALNLKNLAYEYKSVHGLRTGEPNFVEAYHKLNSQQLVPALVINDNYVIAQSLAIIEWLEETYPTPALLPQNALQRAFSRSIALYIACDMHPLNIMRVKKYLTELGLNSEHKKKWYYHWLTIGFDAIESMLENSSYTSLYCCGDNPTFADIFLIPQVYNAQRFHFSMENYPLINKINERCLTHPAFEKAKPENQPDIKEYDVNGEY